MKTIIGISGSKSVGKDTAADHLVNTLSFKKLSFSHPLKKACAYAFNLEYSTLNDPITKDTPFAAPISITTANCERLVEALSPYLKDKAQAFSDIYPVAKDAMMFSPRQLLQFIGTDVIRNSLGPQFWCDAMIKDLQTETAQAIVIPDARFANERKCLRDMGATLIKINRPSVKSNDSHVSENELGGDSEYNFVLTNEGTIPDLHVALEKELGLRGSNTGRGFLRVC